MEKKSNKEHNDSRIKKNKPKSLIKIPILPKRQGEINKSKKNKAKKNIRHHKYQSTHHQKYSKHYDEKDYEYKKISPRRKIRRNRMRNYKKKKTQYRDSDRNKDLKRFDFQYDKQAVPNPSQDYHHTMSRQRPFERNDHYTLGKQETIKTTNENNELIKLQQHKIEEMEKKIIELERTTNHLKPIGIEPHIISSGGSSYGQSHIGQNILPNLVQPLFTNQCIPYNSITPNNYPFISPFTQNLQIPANLPHTMISHPVPNNTQTQSSLGNLPHSLFTPY